MRLWLRRILIGLAALLAVVVLAATVLLTNLAHPWVKARVAKAAGRDLDYSKLELKGLSGLHLEGLVVLNPPEVRATARELLRVETLDVGWTLSDLPKVEQVTARGLTATMVFDESGASSFPPSKEPAAPSPGLSKELAGQMKGPRALDGLELRDVSVTTLKTGGGKVNERLSVTGLALTAKAEADGVSGWKLKAELGDALEVTRNAQQASLKLKLALELAAAGAGLSVELDTSKQTFAPDLAVSELLRARAQARFEPEQSRIALTIEPSTLAGVAKVEGALLLPDDDAAPPLLSRAAVEAQLAPLIALLPAGTVPVALDDGTLRLDASEVTLSAVPRLGPKGTLELKVSMLKPLMSSLTAGSALLDVVAEPESSTQALSATATLTFEALEVNGATTLRVPSGRAVLKAKGIAPAPASPLKVAGDVALSVALASLAAEAGGMRYAVEKPGLELTAPLPQRAPFAAKGDLVLENLRVTDAYGKRLVSAPARLQLELDQATTSLDGKAHAVLDVAKWHALLDATRAAEELAYTLKLEAPDPTLAAPFFPPDVYVAAATIDSTGRVTKLTGGSPEIDHKTSIVMPHVQIKEATGRDVVIQLSSKGDALKHAADAELKLEQLRAGSKVLGPQHLALTAAVDRRKLTASASLATRAGPKLSFAAALAWEAARKAVKCDVKLSLQDTAGAAPLLHALALSSELDVTKLTGELSMNGAVLGLVESVGPAGEVKLVREPVETVGFDGKAALDVAHFRWQTETQTIHVPALKWRSEMGMEGGKRKVHSALELERLVLIQGEKRTIATNVAQELNVSLEGAFEAGALSLTQSLKAATVERRPELPVPVKNVSLSLVGNREPGGLLRLSDVKLTNPETSTELEMKGTLDLSDGRRQLTVRGTLKQDLAALKLPELFEGRGGVELAFRVASPELDVFRARAKLKFKDVHLKLPDNGVDVEGLEGEVAVNESVKFGKDGMVLTKEIDANPYSMLRFADQHPLLSQNSFVTAQRISTQYGEMKPFAGNLTINQNVVSMSQLELGLRGGRVTGQCTLDVAGAASTLEAHVRATGVQSSRGEPFDGNAAVMISAKDRSVNGRAEILRIGNQHLRDLLDIQDPQHADPGINRIRYALTVGYPEHLRLVFDHGFASMKISFGGAARLLKVDDVRGIPVGPLVSRALSSVSLPE